jgi:hypothetical protein
VSERKDLSVGQEVRVFDGNRRHAPEGGYVGTITRVGRTLLEIDWPGYGYDRLFSIKDQHAKSGYARFKTLNQVAEQQRELRALETLRQHGLGPLGWGHPKATLDVLEAAAEAALKATEDL